MNAALAAVVPPPRPDWLHAMSLRWSLIVARDRRPIGVRLTISPAEGASAAPAAELLASVLDGFVADGIATFPRGLVILAPQDVHIDDSLQHWSAPRNVLLEVPGTALTDSAQLGILAALQRHGARLVLNVGGAQPPATAHLSFQYVVTPATATVTSRAGSGVLVAGVRTLDQVQAAFANGAHAMIGWPLDEPVPEAPGSLQPVQKAVLELIRLLQTEADTADLERAFEADPVLTYLLLTLANSPAFRRGSAIGSVTQAITLLGYKRLLKWLVLLLVIASKGSKALPQIYAAVTRGFFMENAAEARGQRALRDDCFVTGAFSLLARITGIDADRLFKEVALPESVVQAVTAGDGPVAPLLASARARESDGARPGTADADSDLAVNNAALLQALACADALQSMV